MSYRPELNGGRWRRIRREVLVASPWCAVCEVAAPAIVDHVVPVADGGHPWNRGNLQALCAVCHKAKTRRENSARMSPHPRRRGPRALQYTHLA